MLSDLSKIIEQHNIKQIQVSNYLKNFEPEIKKKFRLQTYTDTTAPTIFMGLQKPNPDILRILLHEGKIFIMCCEKDFELIKRFIVKTFNRCCVNPKTKVVHHLKNIQFITTTNEVQERLNKIKQINQNLKNNLNTIQITFDIQKYKMKKINELPKETTSQNTIKKSNILYVIISCKKNIDYIYAKNKIELKNIDLKDYIIITGSNTDNEESHYDSEKKILTVNCNDNYEGLPEKVLKAFKFISDNESFKKYTHVFKMDDGVKVLKPVPIDFYKNINYGGIVVPHTKGERDWHIGKCSEGSEWNNKKYDGEFTPWCRGGFGYILSLDMIHQIKNNDNYKNEIYEDLYIAKLLKNINVYPQNIEFVEQSKYLYGRHYNKANQNMKKIENIKNNTFSSKNKNCVHTKLVGGLGNQLFMILNTISLAKEYNLDYSLEFDEDYCNSYFKNRNFIHKNCYNYLLFKNLNFRQRTQQEKKDTVIYQEPEYKYNEIKLDEEKINQGKNFLMRGYFQSYKYFWKHHEEIKNQLWIDNNKIHEIKSTLQKFNKKTLSIHMRLGDYEKLQAFHPIPPADYYKKALSYYNLEDYHIVLFSNNIEEAKKKLLNINTNLLKNIKIADELYKEDEEQFYMLMISDVVIGSNSSFSLIACYLNEIYKFNTKSEYIFPDKWFGPKGPKYNMCDIIPYNNYRFKIVNISSENLKVSILVPTHNLKGKQIKFMKKTLPIIFNQTYKNFEIIITDNNDTTETKDFLYNNFKDYYLSTNPSQFNIDAFDINKIKYTYCETKGWSPNHNHGLDFCTGDLIKILHQDNYFLNQFSLENIVYAFDNNDIKWLVSSYWHEDENNPDNKLYRKHVPKYTDKMVNGENQIGDPSCLTIKKECILKFNESMKYYVDCDYYFRLKQSFGLPYILEKPNIVILQHREQITHTHTIEEVLKEHFELKKIGNDYGLNYDEYPWWVNNNTFAPNSKKIFDKYISEYKMNKEIKTYYINLDNREDRNLEIKGELKKCNITNFERFSAIKPDKNMIENCDLIEVDKLWPKDGEPPNINDEKDFKYIRGAVGCKLSHYNILKKFYFEDKEKYLLVLEDDCVLTDNTLNGINNSLSYLNKFNIKFNILYLSATIHHHEYYNFCEKISEEVLKLKKGWGNTTHAMVFSRETVSNVIKILENSNNEIDDVYKNKVNNRYVTHPVNGFQRASPSDIGLFREEERNITDNSIVFYGELDKRYDYSNIDCIGIKYLVYKPNEDFHNPLSENFYTFLISDLNLGEVKNLDNYNEDVTYICFSNHNEININCNFIYVNDNSIDISIFNEHLNLKFFIELNIDKFNKLREDFSIRKKIAYFDSNPQSLYSCCVTTNIIDINKYQIEINSEKVYVINLPQSVKRKQKFIENNKNINYEIISAILYNPGWLGAALSHKLLIKNAHRKNLEYIKICEDDCEIENINIINFALETLLYSKKDFELLSCFMADINDDVVIEDIIELNENYKLLKINQWVSLVYNIYYKTGYKYFLSYNEKEANSYEKDKTGNLLWTIDRYLKFKHIWVIYPYPVNINNTVSEIWKSKTFDGNNYNDYIKLKNKSLQILKNKVDNFKKNH